MIQLLENSAQSTIKGTSKTCQSLYEQYRPTSWDEVVGQDKAIKQITIIKRRGLSGKAYMITGPSGVGKTTIARLIANEVANDYIELDATTITAKALKTIKDHWHTPSLYGANVFIINESHGLSKDCVRELLIMLEDIPLHAMMIFTTTSENQKNFENMEDATPFLSRTLKIKLTTNGVNKAFAERGYEIAQREGLNGKDLKAYITFGEKHRNNFRELLQHIEVGGML